MDDATDIETDFEDDESSPFSLGGSVDNDSQTTMSEGPRTPLSIGAGDADKYIEQTSITTQGPSGPHLFRTSSTGPVVDATNDVDLYLNMSPIDEHASAKSTLPLTSLNDAMAELDETQVRTWSPRQVARWMRGAGFDSSVVEKFLIHDISGVVLLDLQFEDLRELDITSYGKRHHVMNSIQQLRESCLLSLSPPPASPPRSTSTSRRRGRQRRQKISEDDISPAESASIVAIEQLLPKPHTCSKGENCSKWQRRQRKIERLRSEFPIETQRSVIRPTSEVVPSEVASSDVLGGSKVPPVKLTSESLNEVRPRDVQENVRQFLNFQHVEHEPQQSSVPLTENLRHLPKLTIPAETPPVAPFTPRSATSSKRARTPNSALRHHTKTQLRNDPYHYGGVASPADLYQPITALSTSDLPVTAMAVDPFNRDTSNSVPPHMRYGEGSVPMVIEPIRRSKSTQPRRRRQVSFVPSVAPLAETPTSPQPSQSSSPQPLPPAEQVSGITHSGPVRKRKTTKLVRHEWQQQHCTLKGTQLSLYADEAAAKRDSQALERVDVDDFAVAVSSLASSSKLSAALKKSVSGGSAKAGELEDGTFAFSLVSSDGSRSHFREARKNHHFAVNSRDERIDWMREIMLAKALKKSKAMGSNVSISGNLI